MATKQKAKHTSADDRINNLVVVSDTHCGCKLGLIHPDGTGLDEGGFYLPSALQKKVWSIWESFWNEFVPHATRGEPFDVVMNGDMVDGPGVRQATHQISHNLGDQAEIAFRIFAPVVARCRKFYMIRGTPSHVGQSAEEEEKLAKRLNAVPTEFGQHSRYELWKYCGKALCHFNHHIGTTSSSQHETSAVNAELAAAFVESGRWGHEVPQVICRSHRHRCSEIRIPSKYGTTISFVTACFQLKTPYAFKIAGARMTTPQIGGSVIRQAGDEELYVRHFIHDIGRSKAE